MSKHGSVRMQLQERLDRLSQRVVRIEGDLRSTRDRDWQERVSELENDEVLQGLDEMSLAEVRQIREALSRIESGSYGTCPDCGHPISAERLAAVPFAVACVGCTTRRSPARTGG